MKSQTTVNVKISEELLDKISFVAKSEGRSVNNQFLMMARSAVEYFERTKGRITPAQIAQMKAEAADTSKDNDKR